MDSTDSSMKLAMHHTIFHHKPASTVRGCHFGRKARRDAVTLSGRDLDHGSCRASHEFIGEVSQPRSFKSALWRSLVGSDSHSSASPMQKSDEMSWNAMKYHEMWRLLWVHLQSMQTSCGPPQRSTLSQWAHGSTMKHFFEHFFFGTLRAQTKCDSEIFKGFQRAPCSLPYGIAWEKTPSHPVPSRNTPIDCIQTAWTAWLRHLERCCVNLRGTVLQFSFRFNSWLHRDSVDTV